MALKRRLTTVNDMRSRLVPTRLVMPLGTFVFVAAAALASPLPAGADDQVTATATADEGLVRRATWEIPTWADLRIRARAWIETLADASPDPVRLERARSLWPESEPFDDPTTDRLDRCAASMALLDSRAASLVAAA